MIYKLIIQASECIDPRPIILGQDEIESLRLLGLDVDVNHFSGSVLIRDINENRVFEVTEQGRVFKND